MTEHKFTDDEIIRALECCIKAKTWGDCEKLRCPASTKQGCYFYLRTDEDYENTIYVEMFKDVLDLIKRYKAENEELQSEIKILKDSNINLQELYQNEKEKVAKAKQKAIDIGKALQSAKAEVERIHRHTEMYHEVRAEAIKEFAERLVAIYENDKRYDRPNAHTLVMTVFRNIDSLVKEMTEGGDG